jgi:hypothetical protein
MTSLFGLNPSVLAVWFASFKNKESMENISTSIMWFLCGMFAEYGSMIIV